MARLMLAGTPADVIYETVGIEALRLNPENPRIRFLLKHTGGKKDQKSLMELIKAQPGYDKIQKAIRKANGLHDPIVITHDGLVVEGNNRTTAVATLHGGAKQDKRWQTVPVMRLPRNIDAKTLALLMAGYHIGGKTRWRAYAQAEHIYTMVKDHGASITQIADEARMSELEVQQYLDAFDYLVNEVLPHAKNGNGTDILESKWSHALEFIKTKKNAEHRKNASTRKVVAKLIAEDKIKGAEVRKLDEVISNRKAKAELKKSGFKAASKALADDDPVAGSKLLRQVQALTTTLGKMGQSEIALLKKSAAARKVVKELRDAIDTVADVVGIARSGKNGKA
ncbi:hypothetical protein [Bradyrhizobium sp. SZCCHNS2002]|uniref:hypothetical protein n=1 Tax=Bradyrhizobium sp. SZCCHNS2002 TaxID=3057302 RepID=UPI002916A46C|nr:hypothetical protein [Bradyrhizobium sp. SZCCHNS2002]